MVSLCRMNLACNYPLCYINGLHLIMAAAAAQVQIRRSRLARTHPVESELLLLGTNPPSLR